MDADSGGGEAYGMMETANEMRKIADANDVKFITYVDGYAASAMYGLSAASHEIIVNPDAQVGSIGVVVSLANYSEAEKQYGLKRVYVTAGESKVPTIKKVSSRKSSYLIFRTRLIAWMRSSPLMLQTIEQ